MAGILYYRCAQQTPVTMDDIRRWGLVHAFDRTPTSRQQVGAGPGGRQGVVFADPNRMGTASIGYYPTDQQWEPVPVEEGEPEIWIGWYKEHPPTPVDLARKQQLLGPRVKLADGQEWMIPLIRDWDDTEGAGVCALPQPMRRTAFGAWVFGEVIPIYKALWDAGNKLLSILVATIAGTPGASEEDYNFPGLFDFAATLIGVNYAVGLWEVSALGLFAGSAGDTTAHEVAMKAIAWDKINEWASKKNEAAANGESSSGGEAA